MLRRARLARYELCAGAVILVLAACSSGLSQFEPSPAEVSLSGRGPGAAAHRAKEVLTSTSGHAVNPCAMPSGRGHAITVTADGDTTGRFGGTFSGGAGFSFSKCFTTGETTVSGTFSIASGANSIIGTFSGNASYVCARWVCRAEPTAKAPWSYTAIQTHDGKSVKAFSGFAQGLVGGNCCGGGYMTLHLSKM